MRETQYVNGGLLGYHGHNRGGGRKTTSTTTPEGEERRMRMPREGEVFGIVIGLLGGSRMLVSCKDGKERICRIPGRMKNTIWVRDGDIVIIKIWEIEGDKKGDVVWRFNPIQARSLKEKGIV